MLCYVEILAAKANFFLAWIVDKILQASRSAKCISVSRNQLCT